MLRQHQICITIFKLVSKVFVFALRQIVYFSTATQWTDFDFLPTVRKSSVFLHQSKLSQKRNNRLKFFYIWRCDSLVFYIPCQPSMFVYNCTSFSSPALHFNRQLSPTDRREYARMNAKELVAYSNKEQRLKPSLLLRLNLCHHLRSNVH